jgi:hypothetical protein
MRAPTAVALPVHQSARDAYGIAAAVVCALHCIAGPLVVAAAPALALGWLEHPGVEWALVMVSILSSVSAVTLGWRRHRRWHPLPLLLLGVATLLWARLGPELGEAQERSIVAGAAAALVSAHLVNLTLLRAASRRTVRE